MFFLCYEVFMMIISYNAQSDIRVSKGSLNVKRVAALISLAALLSLAGMCILPPPDNTTIHVATVNFR